MRREYPHYEDMNKSLHPLHKGIVDDTNLEDVESIISTGLLGELLKAATWTCFECKMYNYDEYDEVGQCIDRILKAIEPKLDGFFQKNHEDIYEYEEIMDEWEDYKVGVGPEELNKREFANYNEAADHLWDLEQTRKAEYNNMMVLEYKHFREWLKQNRLDGAHSLFLRELKNQMKAGKFPSCSNPLGDYKDEHELP
jgi:hypothetical protein